MKPRYLETLDLELCRLSQLRVLNLAGNRISGTIPHCFSNFSAMIGEARTAEHWLYAGEYDENAVVSLKGRELDIPRHLNFSFPLTFPATTCLERFQKR